MIRKLLVSNYRSLGPGVELTPGRLTILVGPNGAGKSNLLDVLAFVRDAVTQGLSAAITHRGGIDSVRRRSHGRPFDVTVELRLVLSGAPALFSFVITGDRLGEYRVKRERVELVFEGSPVGYHRRDSEWEGPAGIQPRVDEQSLVLTAMGGDVRFKELVTALSGLTVYSIFPDMLREPQRFDPARPMKTHGENWVSVLRELVRQEGKSELLQGLHHLSGDIEDARVTSAAGYLIAEFKQHTRSKKGKRWFNAAQQSDGTLRVAGLLTALLQQPSLPVIGIEEPELTVHPGALPMVYDYLLQASEVSQILLTTHSPIILDVADVDKVSIAMVDRRDGKTLVRTVSPEQLAPVRQSLLTLGELVTSGELQLSLFPGEE